jgi:hypothetical protein
MSDSTTFPFRGRLRLSAARNAPDQPQGPLTEPERDAIEAALPRGAHLLTYTRGRQTRHGRPVWVLTSTGVLLTTLTDEGFDRVRAHISWVPADLIRRVDLFCEGGLALVRVVTLSKRYVLYGVDEDSATRFVALVRAAVGAAIGAASTPSSTRPVARVGARPSWSLS